MSNVNTLENVFFLVNWLDSLPDSPKPPQPPKPQVIPTFVAIRVSNPNHLSRDYADGTFGLSVDPNHWFKLFKHETDPRVVLARKQAGIDAIDRRFGRNGLLKTLMYGEAFTAPNSGFWRSVSEMAMAKLMLKHDVKRDYLCLVNGFTDDIQKALSYKISYGLRGQTQFMDGATYFRIRKGVFSWISWEQGTEFRRKFDVLREELRLARRERAALEKQAGTQYLE